MTTTHRQVDQVKVQALVITNSNPRQATHRHCNVCLPSEIVTSVSRYQFFQCSLLRENPSPRQEKSKESSYQVSFKSRGNRTLVSRIVGCKSCRLARSKLLFFTWVPVCGALNLGRPGCAWSFPHSFLSDLLSPVIAAMPKVRPGKAHKSNTSRRTGNFLP